ncbi:lysophospholipase [Endozoicomonas sp. Mp262]|uniref:alpha/beta hydrolase n=1 Tax=Endozoicomonas sp. Mp262 TaxID=2919499 RepID=UPI0021DA2E1C
MGLFLLTGCNSTWFYRPNDKTYKALSTISPYPPYFVQSRSGNRLHTLLIPAQITSPKKNTLVIHFHGNGANITWTSQRYGWLTEHGYDLLVFDYSGYGKSSGRPTPKTTVQDAQTLLDHALALQKAHGWKNIILMGTSLGGTVLLQALSQYPTETSSFGLVFIDSSFLSYSDVAAAMIRKGYGGFAFDWIGRLLINDHHAPIRHIHQIPDIPMIVAHCEDDQLIDSELGHALFKQLPVTSKHFWLLNDCQHAKGFTNKHPDHQRELVILFNSIRNSYHP